MKNTIALGQFELQLAEISNSKDTNSLTQEELIDQLPYLFDQYNKGKELAKSAMKENPDLNWKSIEKKVSNLQIPKLSESNSSEIFDEVSQEIGSSIPAAKAELDDIRTVGGGNIGGQGIQALPVLPIVYGLIFLVGLANGVRDGKKKN